MNDKRFDKFIATMRSIRMTDDEKSALRNQLALLSHTPLVQPSPYYMTVLGGLRRSAALAMIVVLALGSITNIVSGEALPGGILYPVKITHEEIKQAVISDPVKRTNYEIKRAERRVQEATKLVKKGQLDETRQVSISKTISDQVEQIQKGIEKIKESDPEKALELHASLTNTLQVNSEILKETLKEQEKREETVAQEEADNESYTNDTKLDEVAQIDDGSLTAHGAIDNDTKETEAVMSLELSTMIPTSMLLEHLGKEIEKIEQRKKDLEEKYHDIEIDAEGNISIIADDLDEASNDLSSLNDIITIHNDIEKIEAEIDLENSKLSQEVLEIIESFKEEAKKLIEEGEYESALELLKNLLDYHNEQLTEDNEVSEQDVSLSGELNGGNEVALGTIVPEKIQSTQTIRGKAL